ncbi:hypothetical protein G7046_g3129 [Stylonectria norvegica]|nr:hypothetical protein G7046_g3129 [Stylonectria norvegica]
MNETKSHPFVVFGYVVLCLVALGFLASATWSIYQHRTASLEARQSLGLRYERYDCSDGLRELRLTRRAQHPWIDAIREQEPEEDPPEDLEDLVLEDHRAATATHNRTPTPTPDISGPRPRSWTRGSRSPFDLRAPPLSRLSVQRVVPAITEHPKLEAEISSSAAEEHPAADETGGRRWASVASDSGLTHPPSYATFADDAEPPYAPPEIPETLQDWLRMHGEEPSPPLTQSGYVDVPISPTKPFSPAYPSALFNQEDVSQDGDIQVRCLPGGLMQPAAVQVEEHSDPNEHQAAVASINNTAFRRDPCAPSWTSCIPASPSPYHMEPRQRGFAGQESGGCPSSRTSGSDYDRGSPPSSMETSPKRRR